MQTIKDEDLSAHSGACQWSDLHLRCNLVFKPSLKTSQCILTTLLLLVLAEANAQGNCVFKRNGKWVASNCELERHFTCYTDPLVLVKKNKTWEEALDHCRSLDRVNTNNPTFSDWNHRYDLVTLISPFDHTYARERAQEATTDEVGQFPTLYLY